MYKRQVVVDASFRTAAARDAARAIASKYNVPFRLLECTAAKEVCRARLGERDRATAVSDGRTEVFDAFSARFEAITELPPTEHIQIDTGGSIETAIAAAEKELATWPKRLSG